MPRIQRKGNTCSLLVGMYIGAATMQNRTEILQKNKILTATWSSNSTLGNWSEMRTGFQYLHSTFAAALFTTAKTWKQHKWFFYGWRDKNVTDTHSLPQQKNYLAGRKKEILSFSATWMDSESMKLSAIKQKETNHAESHSHVQSKHTHTHTHTHTELRNRSTHPSVHYSTIHNSQDMEAT